MACVHAMSGCLPEISQFRLKLAFEMNKLCKDARIEAKGEFSLNDDSVDVFSETSSPRYKCTQTGIREKFE